MRHDFQSGLYRVFLMGDEIDPVIAKGREMGM